MKTFQEWTRHVVVTIVRELDDMYTIKLAATVKHVSLVHTVVSDVHALSIIRTDEHDERKMQGGEFLAAWRLLKGTISKQDIIDELERPDYEVDDE